MPLAFAGALSAASSGLAAPCSDIAPALSRFDYLVLASMADSARPISLAVYRPQHQAMQGIMRIDAPDAPPKSAIQPTSR
jgi:hypothetical protein